MYIILMRHGEAEPETEKLENRFRKLTGKGRKQVFRSARGLAHFLKETPIRIFSSPFTRTRETAKILSEACFTEEIHIADELLQGNWTMIQNHLLTEGTPIALVSHHPFLQSYLLTAASCAIKFETAGIAVIDYDLQWKQGKLIGYFTPGLSRLKKEEK